LVATGQYDLVRLLDAQGVTRLSSPAGAPPISSVVAQHIPEILRSGQVTFQDFHRNEHDQRVYLDILIPILDEQNASRPLGVFYLRINPEKYLYPFIQRWPVPSQTAETLLVRREGNDVLFLNELKFRTNTALNLRISLTSNNMPAVKAVLGQQGIVDGRDYRGAPALAALRAVPDSPWFLVARIDTAEVFAPMRARLWQVVIMIAVLIFGSAACVGLVWRQQQSRFYRAQYESAEALRRSETKFHTLYDSTRDAVMLLDTKGFFDCNPAALAMFGCASREELCSKHPADVSPLMQPDGTDSLTRANQGIATALKKGSTYFEWMHKRIDTGKTFSAEVLLSAMELDGKPVLQAVVRDITGRKQNEAERNKLILDLQDALANVKSLSGLLPICASCKKIRDDKGYWSQVESYVQKHSDATFTHGICPDYIKKLYPDLAESVLGNRTEKAPEP
jgi:PAS domain S-box-containing protein